MSSRPTIKLGWFHPTATAEAGNDKNSRQALLTEILQEYYKVKYCKVQILVFQVLLEINPIMLLELSPITIL